MKNDLFICTICGYVGEPKNAPLDFIEVFLWLVLLPIGIIWTIWRVMFNCNLCPACNKKATMIPTNTPVGKKLYAQADGRDIVYRRQSEQKKCEGCDKKYPENTLVKITSGQTLCPECIKRLKKGD